MDFGSTRAVWEKTVCQALFLSVAGVRRGVGLPRTRAKLKFIRTGASNLTQIRRDTRPAHMRSSQAPV
jgi:hypothetical protein